MTSAFRNGRSRVTTAAVLAVASSLSLPAAAAERAAAKFPAATAPLDVTVTPVGPTDAQMDALKAAIVALPAVSNVLNGSLHRVLWASLREEPAKTASGKPGRGNGYHAILFNYTTNRSIHVEGSIDARYLPTGVPRVYAVEEQPRPNDEEFESAVRTLSQDPEIGAAIASGAYIPYFPMPPVVETEKGEKATERVVTIGLAPQTGDPRYAHQIVGVSLSQNKLVRFAKGAPEFAIASPTACGPPSGTCSGTTCNPSGTAGYELVVSRSGTEIWRFTIYRPTASSGHPSKGSALELRNVDYRGKRVLGRIHVPILNVKYNGDSCGPYRDWQNSEHTFTATGAPVSGNSWLMNASSPPQTILEGAQTDAGTHKGVAYYVDANSVTLMTELTAGWYRYTMTYRFLDDGTIQPRFGFGAVSDSCVCSAHFHHAYFRMDFDIGGAASDAVYESDPAGNWVQATTEKTGRRDRQAGRRWLIQDKVTRDAYMVVPGAYDNLADGYGTGDYWLLRGKGTSELEDGVSCVTCANSYIQIGSFVNGESIDGQDVAFWYGGHYVHNINDSFNSFNHYVGPDLVPSSW